MKTAGMVENYVHCIYSIGLKCFLNSISLFHLVFHLLQSNTRYFVCQLERHTNHYVYIYIYSDTYDVLIDIRNTTYWIVINETLNETIVCQFEEGLCPKRRE